MQTHSALLIAAVALGCGGGPNDAFAPAVTNGAASLSSTRVGTSKAAEATMEEPPEEQSPLEKCLAPVDPTVFAARLGPDSAERRPFRPKLPAADARPCEEASDECRFREARVHYEQRSFDLAAKGFRAVALEGDISELGVHAGQFALDSLNMLGAYGEPVRPACFEVLGTDNAQLIDRYCREPTPPREYQESCSIFFRIAQSVSRLEAERLVEAADRGPPQASAPLYESAGDAFQSVFDEACLPRPKEDWRSAFPVVARCDELLFNAHAAFQAAGAHEKMDAVRRTFFDPRLGLEKSPLAKRMRGPN